MEWLATLPWGKIITALGGLGVAGILTGLSNAVAGHWLGQRKDRTVYRRAKLEEWRGDILRIDWPELGDRPAYAEMRRYMRPEAIKTVEDLRLTIVPGGRGSNPRKQLLLDELARIEREWGLI